MHLLSAEYLGWSAGEWQLLAGAGRQVMCEDQPVKTIPGLYELCHKLGSLPSKFLFVSIANRSEVC